MVYVGIRQFNYRKQKTHAGIRQQSFFETIYFNKILKCFTFCQGYQVRKNGGNLENHNCHQSQSIFYFLIYLLIGPSHECGGGLIKTEQRANQLKKLVHYQVSMSNC